MSKKGAYQGDPPDWYWGVLKSVRMYGATMAEAAKAVDKSYQTIMRLRYERPDLAMEIDEARQEYFLNQLKSDVDGVYRPITHHHSEEVDTTSHRISAQKEIDKFNVRELMRARNSLDRTIQRIDIQGVDKSEAVMAALLAEIANPTSSVRVQAVRVLLEAIAAGDGDAGDVGVDRESMSILERLVKGVNTEADE